VENCLHKIIRILLLSNLTIMPLSFLYTSNVPLCCSSTINQ